MISCRWRPKQVTKASTALLVLLLVTGCASLRSTSSNRVAQRIAQADEAYQHLDADHVSAYNKAVESLAREIDGESPEQLRGELSLAGVKLEWEKIALPLARCHVAPRSSWPNESRSIGAPMLLDYNTTNSPLYPRDGLLIAATAVYRRVGKTPHFCLLTGKYSIELKGLSYPLKIDNVAPITTMARRGRHVAQSGFRNMLHPEAMRERPGIYLTEPYHPNKITLLLVPGLQSTPFAFVDLMKAIRLDPEVSKRVQIWTFLYATGTPVLFNALELRQQLEETIRSLDPHLATLRPDTSLLSVTAWAD